MGQITTKVCSKCGRELTLDHFSPAKGYKNGYYSRCHDCVNQATREYYQAHRDRKRETNRIYQQRYREKKEQLQTLRDCEVIGGYRMYILNHAKQGEYKYTAVKVSTADVFRTNNVTEFFSYLRGVLYD